MTKILLVEDDKSLREIYGVRLLAEGYDIISAGDGEEALAVAIKERPALIVSDVMMPKISGFDMLDILRSTTETKTIKVIMMTALSSEDQRQRGEALGADRYLVKSQVGIEDVVRTVHEVLADAPTATPAQPMFAQPPQPAPVSVTPPTPVVSAPAPAPAMAQAPAAMPSPAPMPTVVPTPTPEPQAPAQQVQAPTMAPAPAPVTPQVAPAPASAPVPLSQPSMPAPTMPQPTAPFSTPRPAGLGDRIIQPLAKPDDATSDSVAKQMEQALTGQQAPMMTAAPQIPPSPPIMQAPTQPQPPTPSQAMAPPLQPAMTGPIAPSLPPVPTATPQMPSMPPTQPPAATTSGLSFEETPR